MSVLNPVFDNWEETGYEEIAGFSPTFYRQIREMDANFKFAGWTADLMKTKLEEFVDNQFAASMDEATLTRIEKWLYLHANTEYDLATRRKMLGAVITGTGKIGRQKIIDIVSTYTGVKPTMSFDHSLTINADITDVSTAGVAGMIKELHAKIPAHIAFLVLLTVLYEIPEPEDIIWQGLDIKFPVYYWDAVHYLDGTWCLDGTCTLNEEHTDWVLPLGFMYDMGEIDEWQERDPSTALWNVGTKTHVETGEDVSGSSGSHMYIWAWGCKTLNGVHQLDGQMRLWHERRYDLTDSISVKTQIETKETTDVLLERSVNLYYLDGEEQLNSDRLLNAFYSKEEL